MKEQEGQYEREQEIQEFLADDCFDENAPTFCPEQINELLGYVRDEGLILKYVNPEYLGGDDSE